MIWTILIFLILLFILLGTGLLFYWSGKYVKSTFFPTDLKTQKETTMPEINRLTETITGRSIVIGIIVFILMIPLALVTDLVNERNNRYQSVLWDISNLWGQQQTLKGPVLFIPFVEEHIVEEKLTDDSGQEKIKIKRVHKLRNAVVLPDDLIMDIQLNEEYRHRGIYDSLVYTARIKITGSLKLPDISKISSLIYRVNWDKAYLSFGLTDTRAINQAVSLLWDQVPRTIAPGTRQSDLLGNGFHVPLSLEYETLSRHTFDLKLNINGSRGIRFSPIGELTTVDITSTWPHPSFSGHTLPDTHEIHNKGFSAYWQIPHIARNYPQTWVLETRKHNLDELLAGVDLFEPVFIYSKITRAVKYGLLFIILTFLTFLIFELTANTNLHFVQYGLIGIALTLFYLTLLSLSEHIGFFWSYLVACFINIGLISSYTAAALNDKAKALIVMVLLIILYMILYSLLQLEDYALLMGTGVLLVIMAILMYLTRNLKTPERTAQTSLTG